MERIYKDKEFWDKILPKLVQFYVDCMLPEILDGRIPRKMTARDPVYITKAQKNKK